jgi:ABC-type multidrug transport system fused ATPase/permease subunit
LRHKLSRAGTRGATGLATLVRTGAAKPPRPPEGVESEHLKRRTGLTRLSRYTHGRGRTIAWLAVVSALAAAAPVAGWLLVGEAVDSARANRLDRLTLVVAAYVGINAAGWGLGTISWRGLAALGQGTVLSLRRDLFEHLTSLSLRYFSEQRAGWIIARLTSDVDALSDVLSQGLATLVSNVLILVSAVIGLFLLDWRLGLVALVVLPPGLVVTRWFQRRSHAAFTEVRNRIAALTAQIAESVAGMAVVQAFSRERAFQAEFDELNAANRASNVAAQKISSVFFPAIEFLGVVATVSVLLVGAWLYEGGSLTIGTLIAAVGLLALVFQPLQELSELYGQVQAASAAMGKITTVLDAEPELRDRPGAERLERIEGQIDFDRVVFGYGATPVLHGIELHVPAGGCIALVGESGGGKSTMARLLGRFYDPDKGAVRVDGRDLRDIRLESYRRQLGVVLQDPFLFSGTIADNIRFARPDATEEQVRSTAAAVGVDRVAARLDGGLDHEVREGGAGLSAGERQLISIARALLADPRILILDEATSNIDRPTEILIERALDRLLRDRTSVIIAHRLATVRRADEILVVDHGRIVQQGSERELLAQEGPFRRLARDLHGGEARRLRPARRRTEQVR